MQKGRLRQEMTLTDEKRAHLIRMVCKPTIEQAMVLRAKIVLLCSKGLSDVQVAKKLESVMPLPETGRKGFLSLVFLGLPMRPPLAKG